MVAKRDVAVLLALVCAAVSFTFAVSAPAALADDPSAEAGAASANVTLRKGDRGKAVKRLQGRLRVGADGIFGPATHRAVKRFQKRRGLTVDGIVGPQTRRALGLAAFKSSEVRRGKARRKKRRSARRTRVPRVLQLIAECESGGDPKAVGGNDGQYRGKYQFLRSTWKSNGGSGDPAKASEAEQDRIALRLYRAEGITPWPVCGRRAKAQLS